MAHTDLAVDACGLSRVYETPAGPVWAAREVTLKVPRGRFACILGPSGSGKSTVLHLLAGLTLPTAGRLAVLGKDVPELNEDARAGLRLAHVGVVFQDHNLIEEFTAEENVMLPLEARGMSAQASRDEARRQLSVVGLIEQAERLPCELSGGQRQRVGIARALVGGREVLLADEPTGALDSRNARALFELLRQLAKAGTAVVLATHALEAQKYADDVYVMSDGALDQQNGQS